MRGCNNFCHYCIVPYTRGRERSRDVESILNEVHDLQQKGYKEVTLLGQNVNSYRFEREGEVATFPKLLRIVAEAVPEMRVRFTTSHPKDMSDETLHVIAEVPPEEVKIRRLNEMIELQNQLSAESNARDVGKTFEVLVEGVSKRSKEQLFGRTEQNKVVVFDRGTHRIGDLVRVRITESSSATLKGIEVTE